MLGVWHFIAGSWQDPTAYNFVSGPLADITLLGGALAIYRKHNCHIHGCWRMARHPVKGTPYVTCAKHHPDVPREILPEDLT